MLLGNICGTPRWRFIGLGRRYADTIRIYTLASMFNPLVNKVTDLRVCSSIYGICGMALEDRNIANSREMSLLVVI
jgi:hypothetical protein